MSHVVLLGDSIFDNARYVSRSARRSSNGCVAVFNRVGKRRLLRWTATRLKTSRVNFRACRTTRRTWS